MQPQQGFTLAWTSGSTVVTSPDQEPQDGLGKQGLASQKMQD